MGERFSALPRLVRNATRGRYPGLGRLRLAGIGLALLYLLSPVDVLPELFLPLLGLGDDAIVALWLAGTFFDETERYLRWERARDGLGGPDGERDGPDGERDGPGGERDGPGGERDGPGGER